VTRIALIVAVALIAVSTGGRAEEKEREKKPAPPTVVEKAHDGIREAVAFLLRTQNEDGSFGYHAQKSPFAIYAPVPGAHRSFRAASTALCLMALAKLDTKDPRVLKARQKGIAWLIANTYVKRSHGRELYNCWAHGYGLKCIARYLKSPVPGMDVKAARATAAKAVKALKTFQMVDGGWGYLNFRLQTRRPTGASMTFTTATVLFGLMEIRDAGVAVPKPMLEAARRNLTRGLTPDGMFIYSSGHRLIPHARINRPQGSLTRNPGCHLARYQLAGDSTLGDIEKAVRGLLAKRKFARMALHRPVPHESWFSVSGYFYLYGYYYAAECCRVLPKKVVAEVRDGLIEEIFVTRHPDGSFWDYPLYGYHKPYGTGYALLALLELAGSPPEKAASSGN